jgi:hypothetical protein
LVAYLHVAQARQQLHPLTEAVPQARTKLVADFGKLTDFPRVVEGAALLATYPELLTGVGSPQ